MEVSSPRKKGNVLEEIQRQKAHILLDKDRSVQKMYKKYKKTTKGLDRLDKKSWYDVYLKNNKPAKTSRANDPHLEA